MRSPVYRPRPRGPIPFVRRIPALLAGCLSLLALSAPALGEGLFYRLQGAGGAGWLLGSLHFGSDDLYPLSEPLQRAFARSDRLLVEVDLLALDSAEVARVVSGAGHYAERDALRRHVPEMLWQDLVGAARGLDMPVRSIEQQHPWLAALTLTTRFLERSGLRADRGVDRHFLLRARRAGMRVVELESFEQQIALLSGLPEAEQVLMLQDTLARIEAGTTLAMELLDAWRTGDRERLRGLLLGGVGSGERGRALMRRLLDVRNVAMARRVAVELGDGAAGDAFVVVGAAHLLGDAGLHRELERLGVRVAAQ